MLDTTTMKSTQPYKYVPIQKNRVTIHHPAGICMTYSKAQIQNYLQDGKIGFRDLTAHEVIMLENALEAIRRGETLEM